MVNRKRKRKIIYRGRLSAGEPNINTDAVKNILEKIDTKEFRRVANVFSENIRMVYFTIILPAHICAKSCALMQRLVVEIEARLKSGVLFPQKESEDKQKSYMDAFQKIMEEKIEPKMEELISESIDAGEADFLKFLEDDNIYTPYRAILYSAIVLIWCSYEVLMKDLWETALNMGVKQIIQNVPNRMNKLSATRGESNILRRSMSLDYLAKYDFDLRKKLGSLLLNKFDFTSPFGVKEAYLCAFPRSNTIKTALESRILIELEARRSVIVHRAGLIDSDYCDKTGTARKEIGHYLEISNVNVAEFSNDVIDIGIKVIQGVSSIVSKYQTIEKN